MRMPWMLAAALLFSGCAGAPAGPAGPPSPPGGWPVELGAEEQRVTHGEDGGAYIDRVFVEARNVDAAAHELVVIRVERLHGSCESPGWKDTRDVAVLEPRVAVTLEASEATRVAIVFDPVPCDSACDRFAFRVHLALDGVERVVEVPIVVAAP